MPGEAQASDTTDSRAPMSGRVSDPHPDLGRAPYRYVLYGVECIDPVPPCPLRLRPLMILRTTARAAQVGPIPALAPCSPHVNRFKRGNSCTRGNIWNALRTAARAAQARANQAQERPHAQAQAHAQAHAEQVAQTQAGAGAAARPAVTSNAHGLSSKLFCSDVSGSASTKSVAGTKAVAILVPRDPNCQWLTP